MEANTPVRFTDKKSQVSEENVLTVFVGDLTKLGTAFSKYLLDTVSIISENCAAYPKTTCALLIAPNSGCWGATYSDADVEKSCQQVETELKEHFPMVFLWCSHSFTIGQSLTTQLVAIDSIDLWPPGGADEIFFQWRTLGKMVAISN